jgi:hypothetical protein
MALKIDQKIVGWSVVSEEDKMTEQVPEQVPEQVDVAPEVQLIAMPPHDRPRVVPGSTYKIKPPSSDNALYITINNMVTAEGKVRPIEIFLNSKSMESFQWITALTRVISALFRQPGDFLFIIDELKQVFDPKGGYYVPGGRGAYANSVVAHIGMVIEEHCKSLGLLDAPELDEHQKAHVEKKREEAEARGVEGQLCSKCGEKSVVLMDGCMTCLSCADSKCG